MKGSVLENSAKNLLFKAKETFNFVAFTLYRLKQNTTLTSFLYSNYFLWTNLFVKFLDTCSSKGNIYTFASALLSTNNWTTHFYQDNYCRDPKECVP